MADLKFWFDSATAPDISPAYAADWDDVDVAIRRILKSTKGASAGAVRYPYHGVTTYPWQSIAAQYISGAQSAHNWTVGDTIDFVTQVRDEDAVAATVYLNIRIVSSDGGTVRGTIYAGSFTAAMPTVWATRHNDGIAVQNAVAMQAGDRIVVEVGANFTAATYGSSVRIADGEPGADFTLVDANDDSDGAPWIAFTFGTPPAATNVPLNMV